MGAGEPVIAAGVTVASGVPAMEEPDVGGVDASAGIGSTADAKSAARPSDATSAATITQPLPDFRRPRTKP
jgi:hypothetical protein